MLYWMCAECNCSPTSKQLEHVIKRNFGGYFDTYEIFTREIRELSEQSSVSLAKITDEKVSVS